MRASVWRVGRTADDRLMCRRSIKAATSGDDKRKREDLFNVSASPTPSLRLPTACRQCGSRQETKPNHKTLSHKAQY